VAIELYFFYNKYIHYLDSSFVNDKKEIERKMRSCGLPIPGVSVEIFDDKQSLVKLRNTVGTFYIAHIPITPHYYHLIIITSLLSHLLLIT
jgi:acyl-CoA synthetase (AMP-forming)/AMP-acid ligase II